MRIIGFDIGRSCWSVGTAEYSKECGTTWRKKNPMKGIANVLTVNSKSKPAGSLLNANEDIAEKKNALRPYAARGNAVAVPRWLGQFSAAIGL